MSCIFSIFTSVRDRLVKAFQVSVVEVLLCSMKEVTVSLRKRTLEIHSIKSLSTFHLQQKFVVYSISLLRKPQLICGRHASFFSITLIFLSQKHQTDLITEKFLDLNQQHLVKLLLVMFVQQ